MQIQEMEKGSQEGVDSLGVINRTVWTTIWDEGEGVGRGVEEGGCTHRECRVDLLSGTAPARLPNTKDRKNSGVSFWASVTNGHCQRAMHS